MEFRKDTLCAKTIIQLYGDLIAPELLSNPMFERCLDECLGTTEDFGKNPNAMVTIENGEISVIYPVDNVNNYQCQCIGEKKEIKLKEANDMQVLTEKYDAKNRLSNKYGWFKDEYEGDINNFQVGIDVEYTSSSYTSNGFQFGNSKFSYKRSVSCRSAQINHIILNNLVNPSKNTTNPLYRNPEFNPTSQYEDQYGNSDFVYERAMRDIRTPFGINWWMGKQAGRNKNIEVETKSYKAKVDREHPGKMVLGEELDDRLWNGGDISWIHRRFTQNELHELGNGSIREGIDKLGGMHLQMREKIKNEFFTELEEIKDTHPEIYEAYYGEEEKGKSM